MPTTLPLDPGDDAEGQLKPIAEFAQPAPATAPAPTPRPMPAAPVAPVQPVRKPTPAPAAAPTAAPAPSGLRTSLNAPSLSLSRHHQASAEHIATGSTAAVAHTVHAFSDEQLLQAWTRFIDEHASDRLLINTMRVSHPQRTAEANVLEMVVESEIQVELINEALPDLLASLRSQLQNDMISIHVRANTGQSSPLTWNEREVLADMIERHPIIKSFVDDLGLSLL